MSIVTQTGARLDPMEFTRYLNERMPYFMVPRYVDAAEAFPGFFGVPGGLATNGVKKLCVSPFS